VGIDLEEKIYHDFKISTNSNGTILFRHRNYGRTPFTVVLLDYMPASSIII